MDCPSCADDIIRSLAKLEGVRDVRVDVLGGKVNVSYDEGKIARVDIAVVIRHVGYQVEDGDPRRATFTIGGMDCADEVRQIEDRLRRLPGVTELQFDLMRRRLVVEGTIASSQVLRAIREIGMTARAEGEQARPPGFWERRGRLAVTVAAGLLLGLAVLLGWLGFGKSVTVPLMLGSTIAGGWFVAPRGWRAIRNLTLDMNFLMMVAAIGAAAIGELPEGASVLFLFNVAGLLETSSMDRARQAIRALMDLSPAEATVRRDGREETVPVAEVRVGEVIVVRPGQKVPLDGEVVAGRSAVDQAPITGESLPVDKGPGAEVFAGSINEQGMLDVRVTRLVEDTTLARIIHTVEEAQATRAPSQSFVDRFARVYTPAVVGLAVLVAVLPPLVGLGAWSVWLYRALAMLVVACPCALVISTPVAIVSGLAAAARGGVLIKGGVHLENAGAITAFAFDKTGTLTEGRPSVTDVLPLDEMDEVGVLRLAAAVERGSEHPLARAILAAAEGRGVGPAESTDFESLPGSGVRATVEGRVVFLGNERLAHVRGLCTAESEEAMERLEREGKTTVLLASESGPLGLIAVADRTRSEVHDTLASLRASGIRRLLMLTGDNEGTARAVAERLGIDEYHAGLLPDDKVRIVRELEAGGERVGFVGDGVNDAPALATATIGIAMGAAGTDVALETADVALMSDDLAKLPFAVLLSRKTLGIVRQNIAFSLALKVVFLALALGGWASLWMAVAADMGGSLAVIANGLRILGPHHTDRDWSVAHGRNKSLA